MPDIEDRFWKKYQQQGLQVVAVDANGDDPSALTTYVNSRHVSYPVGLEDPTTKTYAALKTNYNGLNPFPIDVLVGKDGIITYVAREYDPPALTAAVEAALAR